MHTQCALHSYAILKQLLGRQGQIPLPIQIIPAFGHCCADHMHVGAGHQLFRSSGSDEPIAKTLMRSDEAKVFGSIHIYRFDEISIGNLSGSCKTKGILSP